MGTAATLRTGCVENGDVLKGHLEQKSRRRCRAALAAVERLMVSAKEDTQAMLVKCCSPLTFSTTY